MARIRRPADDRSVALTHFRRWGTAERRAELLAEILRRTTKLTPGLHLGNAFMVRDAGDGNASVPTTMALQGDERLAMQQVGLRAVAHTAQQDHKIA